MMRRFLLILVFCWIASSSAQIPDHPALPKGIQRMAEAGRLWARIRWVHPALTDGAIDWDRALLEALPLLRSSQSEEAYKAALLKMLQPLHDPTLLVGTRVAPIYVAADSKESLVEWLPDRVALVNMHSPISSWSPGFDAAVRQFKETADTARGIVVDLRPSGETLEDSEESLESMLPAVLAKSLQLPTQRVLFSFGYPPQTGATSGGYYTAWIVPSTKTIQPAANAHPAPLVFVVNEWTSIPMAVLAMQRAGLAYLVTEGPPRLSWVVPTEQVSLGEGQQVTFAAGDLIYPDGSTGFGADGIVEPSRAVGLSSPVVRAAATLLKSRTPPGSSIEWRALAPLAQWSPDHQYAETAFPDLALRQLAVIRLWTVMDTFFPYKDLMDRPWADVLPEYLIRMEHVTDARGYAAAIAEMATKLQDNHVRVIGEEIDNLVGVAALPLRFGMVEGRVVVTEIRDEREAAGVHLWDEVLALDGEPVERIIDRMADLQPAANPWTRNRNVLRRAFGRGPVGSKASMTLRNELGQIRTAMLARSKTYAAVDFQHREGDIVRILPGNIGYADLDRLTLEQVDQMFTTIQGTKALILDMRGYPNGTAWSIAPRLNVKRAKLGPLFSPSLVIGGNTEMQSLRASFVQSIPQGDSKPLYRGKVLMLINEMTQSQAEHSGLLFEAVCDLTYVGSASAGSNGDVTKVVLPGRLTVQFTGQGVRHGDGRQLQRTGLLPDVAVTPTLKGLRSGRDEVLERALQFVSTGQ